MNARSSKRRRDVPATAGAAAARPSLLLMAVSVSASAAAVVAAVMSVSSVSAFAAPPLSPLVSPKLLVSNSNHHSRRRRFDSSIAGSAGRVTIRASLLDLRLAESDDDDWYSDGGDDGDGEVSSSSSSSSSSARGSRKPGKEKSREQEEWRRRAAATVDSELFPSGDDERIEQFSRIIDAGIDAASTIAEGTPNGGGGSIDELDRPAETLRGGPNLIFAMARRMLVWDDETYVGQNDTYKRAGDSSSSTAGGTTTSLPSAGVPAAAGGGGGGGGGSAAQQQEQSSSSRSHVLPRWHPHGGISDVNPAFRSRPPLMNARGYGAAIRRNSRKRAKPSLWRHALRTYDKMRTLEEESKEGGQAVGDGGTAGAAGAAAAARSGSGGGRLTVTRSTVHHEGALVACSKLGLWREAFRIYDEVSSAGKEEQQGDSASVSMTAPYGGMRKGEVTDNMVLSLVRACVRGSKAPGDSKLGVEERRIPLDRVADVLLDLEEHHGIPLDGSHTNPLAAAYQHLGLIDEAANLLQTCLTDRTTPIPDEDVDAPSFNVNDVCSKDRASYGILVRGAVTEGDWAEAVDALRDMTEAGMYPTGRDLNVWSEAAEKRERRGRNKRSWKKRRDEYWLEGLR